MIAYVFWSGKGHVGWDGHGFGQPDVPGDCVQCFGGDKEKAWAEKKDDEKMIQVEIKFGKEVKLKPKGTNQ